MTFYFMVLKNSETNSKIVIIGNSKESVMRDSEMYKKEGGYILTYAEPVTEDSESSTISFDIK